MKRNEATLAAALTLSVFAIGTMLTPAHGEDAIKVIDNPGGGHILYETIPGKTTLPDAIIAVLRYVHTRFGDKPQIGRFFQTKGSNSIATFFTVSAKKQDGKRMSGLAIVSEPADTQAVAAVIYDEADHFASSANLMLKKLNEVVPLSGVSSQPRSGSPIEGAPKPEGIPTPLQQMSIPDGSGSIGLPAGWQVLPSSGGGAVHAAGPNGEFVNLGVIVQGIYDTRDPKARSMLQYLAMGHNQFTVCPYGGDLVSAYKAVTDQTRKNRRVPAASIEILNSRQLPPTQYEKSVVLILARVDLHEGKGPMLSSIRVGAMALEPGGRWAMTLGGVGAPDTQAEDEWPTLRAIVKSYGQNASVIQKQTDIVIADINQKAQAARDRAAVVSASNDRRNQSIDQTRDDQARGSQSFQNYQFDQTVVQDNQTGEHGTIGYGFADALVKSDPNRYEYVPQSNFRKGSDF